MSLVMYCDCCNAIDTDLNDLSSAYQAGWSNHDATEDLCPDCTEVQNSTSGDGSRSGEPSMDTLTAIGYQSPVTNLPEGIVHNDEE